MLLLYKLIIFDNLMFKQYYPPFLSKIKYFLNIKRNGIYIDCTFGCGNHSLEILKHLSKNGKLFAFDIDYESILINSKNICDSRLNIINSNFSNIENYVKKMNLNNKINGIIFDLGISSWQLDNVDRGFSFSKNGLLDMRMNRNYGIRAENWINNASKKDILYVIKKYGEERYAKKIVEKIILFREKKSINSTKDLVKIVKSVVKKKYIKSLARVFQAIRIYINDELNVLLKALHASYNVLSNQGRLVVISFHSLEDRIVKNFIRSKSDNRSFLISDIPLTEKKINELYPIEMINLGKYKPSIKDLDKNNRIRSAILRVAEKK